MSSNKPSDGAFSNLPFAGTLNDSLDFAKRMWGAAGLPTLPANMSVGQFATHLPGALPNMIAPTFDTDELDKRIAELRTVEHWLSLNLNMLTTTIQTLEVQRNTIATLKSVTGAMMNSVRSEDARAGSGKAVAAPPAGQSGWPHAPAPSAARKAPAEAQAARKAAEPAGAAPADAAELAAQTDAEVGASLLSSMPINPMMWWGALQDQFARIAAGSADAVPANGTAAAEGKAATEPAEKPARGERERAAARKTDEPDDDARRSSRRTGARSR